MKSAFILARTASVSALLSSGTAYPNAQEAVAIPLSAQTAAVGTPPSGCRPALTGEGGPVAWQVMYMAGKLAVAETSRAMIDNRFPICIVDQIYAADVELGVSFTPIEGTIDRAAGLIFRVKDADNYYVVRANALENNVNLYHVVRGVRRQFAGATAAVESGKPQRLRVKIEGDLIKISLNGKSLFEAHDRTISGTGAVGIWTKADSVTAFQDFDATLVMK